MQNDRCRIHSKATTLLRLASRLMLLVLPFGLLNEAHAFTSTVTGATLISNAQGKPNSPSATVSVSGSVGSASAFPMGSPLTITGSMSTGNSGTTFFTQYILVNGSYAGIGYEQGSPYIEEVYTVPSGTTYTPTAPGTYTFAFYGYGGDAGIGNQILIESAAVSITVYNPVTPLTGVTITGPATYTGGALTPTYTTTPSGGTVTFSPTSETNAGSYTLNWTATGAYSGSGTASWTINKASLAAAAVQGVVYNGSAQEPSAVTSTIPAGVPVTVSSTSSHTNVGTYTDGIVTTAGNANLNAGTLSGLSWTISGVPITAATIQSVPNNGAAQFPSAVTSVTPSGATVSVTSTSSHTAAGSYSDGIVTGTGNFSGTLSGLPWTITSQGQAPVSLSPSTITVAYGQSATLTASGGSGTGAYTFTNSGSTLGSPVITSTTDTVAFSAIGNSSVSLYRAGDSNYAQSGTTSATVTVTKATPMGSLASQTITSSTALTSQMLSAVFTNPNSTTAVAPTGTVTYSAANYGAIAVGATLPLGQYTVTASYPGDSNYNAATTTATFTVITVLSQNIYNYNGGGTVTYTAPAQTNYVIAKVWGAGGGEGVGCPGGGGGFSYGATSLNAGQTLSVLVGGAGSGYQTGGPPGGGTAAGLGGAGGGGYSRVSNTSLGIDVWGGAGGGGGNGANFSGVGGAGGGPNASPGGGGPIAGGGGTQTGGGSGGSGNDAPGSLGTAGVGGASNDAKDYIGGGGGAGYYGGGGGGTGTYGSGGGGGGGGSSYITLPSVPTANSISYFSNGSGTNPGGITDPDFPTSSGAPTVAAGANAGTYTNGLNGYVVIDSVIMPKPPTFTNVPSQGAPATYINMQPVSYAIQAYATPAITSYSVAAGSSLPPGFTLNATTGVITGTYSSPATLYSSFTPGNVNYSTQITATNSFASTTVTYYWQFNSPVITESTAGFSNPTPLAGASISFNYTVSADQGINWTENELWLVVGSPDDLGNTTLSGFPTTYSGSENNIIVPPEPGIYTYQLRVVDKYSNFTDFWKTFVVGEETDSIPYSTSFEPTETPPWPSGKVDVENGWMTWQGGAYVVSSPVEGAGTQSLQLMGSTQYAGQPNGGPILAQVVKAFNTNNPYNGAYIDEFMQPVAASSVLNSSIVDNTDGEVGFQTISSSQATVMVLNGNGTGGGAWSDTGIHFAIDSTGKATSWMEITFLHNYSNFQSLPSHTWYLWINGAFYPQSSTSPTAFGMINTTATSITAITWIGSSNTGYLDNLHLETTNPFPTPAAPTITSVSSAAAGSITVNWSTPSDPFGINSYQLESAAGSGSYSVVATTTGNSYTVTGLTAGTTYSFRVMAENVSGNFSPWSTAFSTTLTSLQLVSGTQLTFTYNGVTQGPTLSSSTITAVPSTATYVLTGQASATNAGIYSAVLTPNSAGNPSFVGPPLTISWTLNPATPTLTLTASPTTVSPGGAVTFTAHPTIPGGGTITYTWSVSPSGPSGLSGSGTVQTLTFATQALSGSPPKPEPYTISVYSNANPPNYLQSSTVQYQISVTVPNNQDTSNSTVQLNLHAPAQ